MVEAEFNRLRNSMLRVHNELFCSAPAIQAFDDSIFRILTIREDNVVDTLEMAYKFRQLKPYVDKLSSLLENGEYAVLSYEIEEMEKIIDQDFNTIEGE